MPKTQRPARAAPATPTPVPASRCPHLGDAYNPFKGPHLQTPYPFFARLRKEAPVSFNSMLGMWLVSRQEDINEVLNNAPSYSSASMLTSASVLTDEALAILGPGPILHDSPLNTDPPAHTRLRRLLQRGFLPARIARQEASTRQLANTLIDTFIHKGRVDLVSEFTYPFPMHVILSMVGVPHEDMDRVKRWCDDLFGLIFSQVPPEAQPAMARGIVEYRDYCADLIAQRRREPREDLTSYLVHTEPGADSLNTPELISLLGGSLIGAGHEATTAQLGLILLNLLEQPERWQALCENPSLIPRAVEECIRLESASHGMVRTAVEDVRIGGVMLPKGSRLLLLYSSANHDEAGHANPEQYDLHRQNLHHLGFGHGVHYCLGSHLARLEMCVAIELFVQRLPGLRLVANQDVGYHQELLILRNITQLQVEWPVEAPPPGPDGAAQSPG
ncbi:cytochrome P450 [Stigmatella hybrida]|uniref:cytochrome P450 n=1 Tax=Stigmatella hybrida TaxID=394097 RepID=UPI001CDB2510|nr:cytochrome P450 [Stigmatella hybrida]